MPPSALPTPSPTPSTAVAFDTGTARDGRAEVATKADVTAVATGAPKDLADLPPSIALTLPRVNGGLAKGKCAVVPWCRGAVVQSRITSLFRESIRRRANACASSSIFSFSFSFSILLSLSCSLSCSLACTLFACRWFTYAPPLARRLAPTQLCLGRVANRYPAGARPR